MPIKRLLLCAILMTLAMALSLLERLIPLGVLVPLPGVKLGLANLITLYALVTLRKTEALAILIGRVLLVAFISGNLMGLLLSLLGGLFALFLMMLLLPFQKHQWISFCGVSMAGAAAHAVGQMLGASLWLGSLDAFGYLPVLLLTAIPTGLLTGILARRVLSLLPAGHALYHS